MKCPFCTHRENKVIDSRLSKDSSAIRRRRECLGCERRFTTYEFVEEVLPTVVKKDGRREPFDRAKILAGIKKACDVQNACQEYQDKEIASSAIGEIVMKELHGLDGVAYVRFASVYRQFRDVVEFVDELKDFLKADKKRNGK
jgi:transcriptional repressor NrdR